MRLSSQLFPSLPHALATSLNKKLLLSPPWRHYLARILTGAAIAVVNKVSLKQLNLLVIKILIIIILTIGCILMELLVELGLKLASTLLILKTL